MIKIERPQIQELVIRHYEGLKYPYEYQFHKYVSSHKFKDVIMATPDKLAEISRDFKTPSKKKK